MTISLAVKLVAGTLFALLRGLPHFVRAAGFPSFLCIRYCGKDGHHFNTISRKMMRTCDLQACLPPACRQAGYEPTGQPTGMRVI